MNGKTIGRANVSHLAFDEDGNVIGTIQADGTVVDKDGNIIGKVRGDGSIVDENGNECTDSYMLAWDNKPKSLLETTLNTRDAVWCASGPERGLYAAIFNLGEEDSEVSISLEELEIYHPVNATELWSGRTGVFEDSINVSVPGHGAMVFLLE